MMTNEGSERCDVAGLEEGGKGLQTYEYKKCLESGKDKEEDSPLEPVTPWFGEFRSSYIQSIRL